MKTFFFFLPLLIIWGIGPALASPFLVCDPVAEGAVISYDLEIDGKLVNVPAVAAPEPGKVWLHYDIAGILPGQHAGRCRTLNLWGASDWCPFSFTVLPPPKPTNLKVVLQ